MGPNKRQARDAQTHFSRSCIGGKKTAEIKFRVADDLKDELARRARELGFASESELAELLLAIGLFGKSHVATFQQSRLERAAKLFHEEGEPQS
jgi:pyruvate/oxaloacetate carboxyltransferase